MFNGIKLFFKLISQMNNKLKWTIPGYITAIVNVLAIMVQPMIFAYIIDEVLIKKNLGAIYFLLLLSLGIACLSIILSIISSAIFRYLEMCNTLDMREVVLRHLRKLYILDIEKTEIGKYQMLLGLDTARLSRYINVIVVELVSNIIMLMISIIVLLYMDYKIGLIGIISTILVFISPMIFRKKLRENINFIMNHNEKIVGYLYECIEGSKDIKILDLEDWENKRNKEMYRGLIKSGYLEGIYRSSAMRMGNLIISIVILIIYWLGSIQVVNETLTIGILVASISYLNTILMRAQNISSFYGEYQNSQVAMKRIDDFLAIKPEIHSGIKIDENRKPDKKNTYAEIIHIKNLEVKIGDVEILKNINLPIEKNKKIAVLGLSGSGKTTLYKTILGLQPFQGGDIFIQGRSIKEMAREEINARFGIVFQDSFLFKGTLLENISIADLKATYDDVYEASLKANLKDLIDKLPDGLHTVINTKGKQLSGGEKQRITIARIFLRKPDILILDEPTSSLDRLAEYQILDALEKLMENKTTLFSTHRLEILERADVIYVLENGVITESGSHNELKDSSEFYKILLATCQYNKTHPVITL